MKVFFFFFCEKNDARLIHFYCINYKNGSYIVIIVPIYLLIVMLPLQFNRYYISFKVFFNFICEDNMYGFQSYICL